MFQGQIKCKGCGERFSSIEWLNNTKCDEPNCTCPRVQEVQMRARQVIAKAANSSSTEHAVKFHTAVSRSTVPHGYDETKEQLFIKVPDVKVMELKRGK